MKKKMRLQTSLYLSFFLVVALTICLVSVLSGTFINRQFEEYVRQNQKEQADDLADSIGSHYDIHDGGWNIDYVHGMGMYALNEGFIIKLFDKEKNLLWDAENHDMALCHEVMDSISHRMEEKRPDIDGDFVTYTYELKDGEHLNGFLEISYYTPYYLDENEFRFIEVLNRILGIAGALSLVVSVLLGIFIAGRITRPISDAVSVTGRISEGDYGARVDTGLREKETYELAEAVNHMAATLEEQEFLRKQMTDDIAHELRTPVTNISSYIEMMIDGVMEPSPERLKSCYDELSRLSGLIADLERLENAETGELTLNKEDVDIYSLARTVMQGFETKFREKDITGEITGEEAHSLADKGRMGQVIANLLSNAVKYTDKSGRISVSVRMMEDRVVLTVEDNGMGIPKEDVNRVFERFYRTDKSRNRETGGAGIGLSISKAIVQAHGGTIRCESEPGAGSRFTVELPGI